MDLRPQLVRRKPGAVSEELEQIGRYRILESLGQGAMADV